MKTESLYEFYESAVLPQFGIVNATIEWKQSRRIEGDEFVHTFQYADEGYVLFFEDYASETLNESYINNNLLPHDTAFTFVEPTSQSNMSPSYDGFKLIAPSRYCENVTGVFTLLKLVDLATNKS